MNRRSFLQQLGFSAASVALVPFYRSVDRVPSRSVSLVPFSSLPDPGYPVIVDANNRVVRMIIPPLPNLPDVMCQEVMYRRVGFPCWTMAAQLRNYNAYNLVLMLDEFDLNSPYEFRTVVMDSYGLCVDAHVILDPLYQHVPASGR